MIVDSVFTFLLILFTISVVIRKIFAVPCKMLKKALFCCAAALCCYTCNGTVTLQQLHEIWKVK